MKTSSILDTYQTWLTHREYSPATIQKYTKALARFFADTGAGDIPTRETVAAWRDSLTEKGYTPATVNAMLAAVNDCQESIDNVAGKAIQHLAKQKHNLTRIHTLGYIEEPQFIERSAAIEQQIRERKQQLSRNDMSNTSEKILQKTRLIQKKLSSTPPLELFDESVFKELVKKVLISNTAIQFELINGMKLSESRAAT